MKGREKATKRSIAATRIARYPTLADLQAVTEPTEEGCLIWQRALDSGGYGSIRSKQRTYRAHEIAWFLSGNERPEGYTLHHLCHNRACIEVTHLVCITKAEHWEITKAELPDFWDRHRAGIIRQPLCSKGHDDWYISPTSGDRQCRECQRIWKRQNYSKKKKRKR